jgi:hypothetical protein
MIMIAPKRKPKSAAQIISPQLTWDCMEELNKYMQTVHPGARLIAVREVKRFECTLELPPIIDKVPPLCAIARLWSFKDEKTAAAFNNSNGHLPILAQWKCRHCNCFHYWTASETGNNGECLAGAFKISPYLRGLINDTSVTGTVKTYER